MDADVTVAMCADISMTSQSTCKAANVTDVQGLLGFEGQTVTDASGTLCTCSDGQACNNPKGQIIILILLYVVRLLYPPHLSLLFKTPLIVC